MTELKNKVVLLTGANGGLGREMTNAFLNEGCHLILTDIQEFSAYKNLSDVINNGKILGYISADISNEEGCKQLFSECQKISKNINLLVNNAGIAVLGSFTDIPDEKWEKILAVNLVTPIRLIKLFLPLMVQNQSGHIINISSVAGFLGAGELATYSASKAGIALFGEAIKDDYFSKGINVTNVYPFFTRTPILDSPQFGVNKRKVVPGFLLCEPKDVVRAIISGIKKDKLSIYPGFIAKFLNFSKRIAPNLFLSIMAFLRKLEQKQEKKMLEASDKIKIDN